MAQKNKPNFTPNIGKRKKNSEIRGKNVTLKVKIIERFMIQKARINTAVRVVLNSSK